MSLLTIVQQAMTSINLPSPTAVISSNDELVKQFLALSNEEGKSLSRRFDWQRLVKEGSFTTLAAETQVAVITTTFTDYGLYIPTTMWNRTSAWPVIGPIPGQEWAALKASGLNASTQSAFRIRGDSILFYPTPTAGDSVYFEYISKNWNISDASVEQSAWVSDTDTALIDEELIKLGIKWRFLRAKGLSYGEEFNEYEMAVAKIAAHDGARPVIDMNYSDAGLTLTVPESSWDID